MILVRTLQDNVWWYVHLDPDSEPYMRPDFKRAWVFAEQASAERVINHLTNHTLMKNYRLEVHELKAAE